MIDPIDLGPKLEPPPGGLSRLQQSVSRWQAPERRRGVWRAAAVTAGLAVLVVLVTGRSILQSRRVEVAIEGALMVAQETKFDNGAYQVLPSHGRNVRILLIGTLPAPIVCVRAPTDRNRSKDHACPPLSS